MTKTAQPLLRAAIIGAGYTAGFQLTAWSQIQGVEVVAVVDRDQARAERRAAEFGIPAIYTDYHNMLALERLDFIDIATPPSTHLDMIESAATHGVNVLCQKPVCATLADLEWMIRVCREAGTVFAVNENCRFQPSFRRAKSLIEHGDLGVVHHLAITGRSRLSLPSPDFGEQTFMADMPRLIVFELGVHFLDALRFLLGEATVVYAQTRRISTEIAGEDTATIMLDVGGVTAVVDLSWASIPSNSAPAVGWADVRIEGSQATIDIRKDGRMALFREDGHAAWDLPRDSVQCGYQELQQHFINCLRNGVEPETSGDDTIKTMELVFGAYFSADHSQPYRVGKDLDKLAQYDLSAASPQPDRTP